MNDRDPLGMRSLLSPRVPGHRGRPEPHGRPSRRQGAGDEAQDAGDEALLSLARRAVNPTAWRNDGSVAANTLNSPALTTLAGRPVLVYNRGGQLYRRISPGVTATWGAETRITTGIPGVVGRPSVMAAGNTLDVVSLGGARHSDGGFSLYRNAYSMNQLGQMNSLTGWTEDPSSFESGSAPYLWAEVTAVVLIVNMVIRGLNNGLPGTR
jgi:hypothetical protein